MEIGTEIEFAEWTVNYRLASFKIIDVLLNCAMKDGLNLLPFEWAALTTTLLQNKNKNNLLLHYYYETIKRTIKQLMPRLVQDHRRAA